MCTRSNSSVDSLFFQGRKADEAQQSRDDMITIQLLGREDLTVDDAETASDRWKQYIESYALVHATEGLPHRVDRPFLQRSLVDIPEDVSPKAYETHSGLEIKIALGNYKMFFTPGESTQGRADVRFVAEGLYRNGGFLPPQTLYRGDQRGCKV